jgi:hypothetical protein
MTKEEYLESFKKPLFKKKLESMVNKGSSHPNDMRHLLELSLHKQPEIAFRSAWLLEQSVFFDPPNFSGLMEAFAETYVNLENDSAKRHFTKILIYFSDKGRIHFLKSIDLEFIVEKTLEWLINPNTPVAVQANCMDILYNLRQENDWLQEELKAQLFFILKGGSAALQSRGRKLLKLLS